MVVQLYASNKPSPPLPPFFFMSFLNSCGATWTEMPVLCESAVLKFHRRSVVDGASVTVLCVTSCVSRYTQNGPNQLRAMQLLAHKRLLPSAIEVVICIGRIQG